MNNFEISERKNISISRAVGMMTQIYADRAENSEIWDVEGNRYIDFPVLQWSILAIDTLKSLCLCPLTVQDEVFSEALDILEKSIIETRVGKPV